MYHRIIHKVHNLVLFLVDSLCLLAYRTDRNISGKKILLVRLNVVGDFILWLDAAKDLRKLYPKPEYELVLLGNNAWTSLAESNSFFDKIWPLDRQKYLNSPVYRWRIIKNIRRGGFHAVIQPTFSRAFILEDSITRISGAVQKIGFQGDSANIKPWLKRMSDRWYTRLIRVADEPQMELIRNAEFMRAMGLPGFKAGVPQLPVHRGRKGSQADKYFVLFPGAGAWMRQWPTDNFIALAKKIYRETGWVTVLCGGSQDEKLGNTLEGSLDVPIQNMIGRTSLQELASCLAGAQLLVSNETSAIHIAAAVSTPSFCIAGGGHYGRFVPYHVEVGPADHLPVVVTSKMDCYGCNWKCKYSLSKAQAAPCITDISVDAVWSAIKKWLDKELC